MKNILIIESESIIALSLSNFLSKLGYTVTRGYPDSKHTIDCVKQNQFDLIIINIKMQNGLDRIETVGKIRDFSQTPVIYLTGETDRTTLDRAKRTNPVNIISKPFNYTQLGNVIEQCWAG
ncbi:MAG: response regulator [Balneolales bacterium]